MKRIIRIIINILVILSIPMMLVSGLAAAKVVYPLIVVTGSMEPEIGIGSLIISTNVKVEDLNVGDIASFQSEDGVLVTHRIISNEEITEGEGIRTVKMKGDANETEDENSYIQSSALKPLFVIPVAGATLTAIGVHKYEIIAVFGFGIGIWLIFRMIHNMRENHKASNRRRSDISKNSEKE